MSIRKNSTPVNKTPTTVIPKAEPKAQAEPKPSVQTQSPAKSKKVMPPAPSAPPAPVVTPTKTVKAVNTAKVVKPSNVDQLKPESASIEMPAPPPALVVTPTKTVKAVNTAKVVKPSNVDQLKPESAFIEMPAPPPAPVVTPTKTVKAAKTAKVVKPKNVDQLKPESASIEIQDKLRIFQIYYEPEQHQFLDPAFEPYDNTGDFSPLLEFNVFRKLANSDLVKGADLWGAVSWKFLQKTGLAGADLRAVIDSHPGHDVYYCNPYPECEALYHNFWLQGETSHPNFLVLCQEFFEVAGLSFDTTKTLVPSDLFAASNYFIASPKFWLAYMKFVDDAIAKAERGLSKTAKAMIYSSAADRIGVHAGASYLPFIVERLFCVFLADNQKSFSSYKYSLPGKEESLNVHLKLLRQMKDLSVKNKSLWMATCWVNYRNLYMSNSYGADWCRKYLKNITPTEFKYIP